jgi:putative oxidoreductase
MNLLHPISRILIALIFIMSGFSKITNYASTRDMMSATGFPIVDLFLIGTIIVELGGGIALLLGFMTRWAALALTLFLIPTTLIFHAAHISDPLHGQEQLIQVLKNLAIMGGLLKFVIEGAGAYSLDESNADRVRHVG